MSINWKRGLHRVFLFCCAIWSSYVLIVVPWQHTQKNIDFAAWHMSQTYLYDGEKKKEHQEFNQKLWKEASLPATYSSLLQEKYVVPFTLGALVLPPLLVYGLAAFIWRLYKWFRDGFTHE